LASNVTEATAAINNYVNLVTTRLPAEEVQRLTPATIRLSTKNIESEI